MHLGLKDIRFAKGRFFLMGTVIALITFLLVMLTGLTSGLGNQSVSAIKGLHADRIIFGTSQDGAKPSFTESQISTEQLKAFQQAYRSQVTPLGISAARAQGQTSGVANVAVFGGAPSLIPTIDPAGADVSGNGAAGMEVAGTGSTDDLAPNSIYVDRATADTLNLLTPSGELQPDAQVTINGTTLTVAGLSAEQWYSHMPVVWTSTATWAALTHAQSGTVGTVLTIEPGALESISPTELDQLTQDTSTAVLTPKASVRALASYSSENGSLTLMQAFLYGISGLVIAAFVAVWTVQRTRDIAVLRALGAPTSYVARDGLLQAFVIVVSGSALGGLLGYGAATLASGVVPISVTWMTVVLPILGIVGLGTAAAYVAVRQASRVNPLLALGGN